MIINCQLPIARRLIKSGFIMRIICLNILSVFFLANGIHAQSINLPQQQDRWSIQPDGSIEWKINGKLPHDDHIEMSGEKVSLWIRYGVDTAGRLSLNRTLV